jgi:hypothetical protein
MLSRWFQSTPDQSKLQAIKEEEAERAKLAEIAKNAAYKKAQEEGEKRDFERAVSFLKTRVDSAILSGVQHYQFKLTECDSEWISRWLPFNYEYDKPYFESVKEFYQNKGYDVRFFKSSKIKPAPWGRTESCKFDIFWKPV